MTRERAAEILFHRKRFATLVRRLARLRVAASNRADVAQDVLTSAFASFHRYDPARARPEAWLNSITVHVAARHNDRAQHRREVLVPVKDQDVPDEQPRADERIAFKRAWLLLIEALNKIDVDQRAILIIHDIDGVPMTDVAAQHGIPLTTAYKWRARAMAALRTAVEALEIRRKS